MRQRSGCWGRSAKWLAAAGGCSGGGDNSGASSGLQADDDFLFTVNAALSHLARRGRRQEVSEENIPEEGAAIFASNHLSFSDSVFLRNAAVGDGGAIWGVAGGSLVGSWLCDNVAGKDGGGIYLQLAPNVDELAYNVFAGNSAQSGGGVWTNQATVAHNNDFLANAYGVIVDYSAGAPLVNHIVNNDFVGNTQYGVLQLGTLAGPQAGVAGRGLDVHLVEQARLAAAR